ncbi:cation:proton antiporter [Bifidobacterium thermacidophilum]|uniref:Na(+)/H(+) antiporter-like protein n=2 Tax=Bifidobacterium thermacidophilum TaxID=246618 RepID=A0A087E2L0_9BIFI|nr:cation:proton antiporter [Bifidobacterium thermacidophilum]KFJ02011.1 Na(+)/H(+) antiporter-like protein [Bifidobacterium thermacidophilum subsp. thermacidophilum]
MIVDLVSLTIIMLVAVLCPVIVQLIPGKPVPQTVLLLLAGALLGPHMFGVIQVSESVQLLSELGLAFLFLLAGYEIDPKQLGGHQGRVGLATWAATFVLAFAVITFVPYFKRHDMTGMAAVITLTTTALGTLMPILKERGLEGTPGTPVGNAVVAYGTWGELCPVLMMAVLLSTRSQWQTFITLAVFAAICVVAALVPAKARKAGNRFYRLVTKHSNISEQVLMRLTVLLLITLVTVSAIFDLDVVLGAFAAGFILRYVIPEGSQTLETRLDGISYGFFIPIFFVVSGAAIDLKAVGGNPGLLIVFIVVLMLIRAVPVYIAMSLDRKANPISSHHRVTVAVYCATALPLIVAVTTVAVKAGTMQQMTASTLVAAGAVTMFLMPLLAGLTYRVADVHPVTAIGEIAHDPHDYRQILHEHIEMAHLLRHAERMDVFVARMDTLPPAASAADAKLRAELVQRAERERDRCLRELGIDPATAQEYREDTVKRWRQAASKRAGGAAGAGGTGGSAAGDADTGSAGAADGAGAGDAGASGGATR